MDTDNNEMITDGLLNKMKQNIGTTENCNINCQYSQIEKNMV